MASIMSSLELNMWSSELVVSCYMVQEVVN